MVVCGNISVSSLSSFSITAVIGAVRHLCTIIRGWQRVSCWCHCISTLLLTFRAQLQLVLTEFPDVQFTQLLLFLTHPLPLHRQHCGISNVNGLWTICAMDYMRMRKCAQRSCAGYVERGRSAESGRRGREPAAPRAELRFLH